MKIIFFNFSFFLSFFSIFFFLRFTQNLQDPSIASRNPIYWIFTLLKQKGKSNFYPFFQLYYVYRYNESIIIKGHNQPIGTWVGQVSIMGLIPKSDMGQLVWDEPKSPFQNFKESSFLGPLTPFTNVILVQFKRVYKGIF